MSFHASSIDDLRDLDLAVERFSYGGRGPLHTMSRSIDETNDMLEERLAYWERELNERERAYSACMAYTDDEGRPRDCSYEAAAVQAAYDALERLRSLKSAVGAACDEYAAAADRFRGLLTEGCADARRFLQSKIDDLEHFNS